MILRLGDGFPVVNDEIDRIRRQRSVTDRHVVLLCRILFFVGTSELEW